MTEEFNTIAAEKIICPHCGSSFGDDLQMCDLNGIPMEYDCEHCDKPFELTADINVTFSTRKLKE
jgi:DNA-directed RNA polymerase subunit RPC12/RpoP